MTDSLKIRKLIDTQTPGLIRHGGKEIYLNREMLKNIKKLEQKGGMIGDKFHSGGILPLAALLPLIFAGVTAAGATAASISKTVSNAREAQKNQAETEKIRQETANLAAKPAGSGLKGKKSKKKKKGKGIEDEDEDEDSEEYENENENDEEEEDEGEGLYLDDYIGKGIQKFFREQINQSNKDKKSKNKLLTRNRKLGGKLRCRFTGKGLYLEPWDPNSKNGK